ncbi:MAG TPA: tetratricopeptide repeat protein [Vicinamibacteria bacterium]|nr:tetratricopeptide repeat protein [Vicinamibacteria bacterium]
MNRRRGIATAACFLLCAHLGLAAERRFEWSTESAEAKSLLADLQARIENFEAGPHLAEIARKIVAADPKFAMGEYYLSAVAPPNEGQAHLDKAVELSKSASEGERRFIEAMAVVRANQGANFAGGIPLLEKIAADYPGERLTYMLLGQLYQGSNDSAKARATFEKALAVGPPSARARSFIANDDLLREKSAESRAAFASIERELPKGSLPFVIRYGVAFSHLYEGHPEPAVDALETYLAEYRESGASQGFPEVFIWNSIARIHLETGNAAEAMKAYEKGYESVPGSTLPEDQKQLWYGRLLHGKCRTLAKMGKHQEAWTEAEKVRMMIEEGGEAGKQYLLAYHYLAGYLKLERGEIDEAVEQLEKADPRDPFHRLLLARAYERKGDKEAARKTYAEVVGSTANGIERALAYPEAKRKLATL